MAAFLIACLPAAPASVPWTPIVTELAPDPRISTPHKIKQVVYGQYYSYGQGGSVSTEGNTYYIFTPSVPADAEGAAKAASLPMVVEYHGGGFTGGAATSSESAKVDAYLKLGIAFASMDYRLVATKYYYAATNGAEAEEEFIRVDADGRLTIDDTMVSSDYKVRIGRQEFNTKCSYDATKGFDDLLGRAPALGIDVHRIGFTGGSAGGGEIHYLTWVYPALDDNWKRYTVVSMVYTMAQLDYPVQNMLDKVWSRWAGDVGADTPLSTILSSGGCSMVVGNPWCEQGQRAQTDLCNKTWHEARIAWPPADCHDAVVVVVRTPSTPNLAGEHGRLL